MDTPSGQAKGSLGIFLSYRREDSAGHAGRLYDRLVQEFGKDHVFMDVDSINPGEDFARVIDERMRRCDVCLVVIGKAWLKVADPHGRRRLDKPDDWIRLEVGAALTQNVWVVPVLLDDAERPPMEALPSELTRLVELNDHPIHHLSFRADTDRLIEKVKEAVELRRAGLARNALLAGGEVRINPRDDLPYVWIPPGEFLMGRVSGDQIDDERYDDERPQHPVCLTHGFWMSRVPVTVAAYMAFVLKRGVSMPPPPKDNPGWSHRDHPIVNVTWAEARDYCSWMGGRLPTEAQWEYAARGGVANQIYPWGNDINAGHANYAGNQQWRGTSPVGRFAPNGFGLFDMIGNVWEWVADCYDESAYARRSPQTPREDPQEYTDKLRKRVVRGGSWDSIDIEVRTSNRGFQTPHDGFRDFGFRCLVEDL